MIASIRHSQKIHQIILTGILINGFLLSTIPIQISHAGQSTLFAKPNGVESGSCENWDQACDLQYALSQAVSGQAIWVMAGTYTPGGTRSDTFQLTTGVDLYGGFSGAETLLSQRDISTYQTILSGDIGVVGNNADNSYHVVNGSGVTDCLVDGITIQGGNSNESGAGLAIVSGSLTLNSITFQDNSSEVSGGGLYLSDAGGSSLNHLVFQNNTAANLGGGLYAKLSDNLVLEDTVFSENSAMEGAGMEIADSDDITLSNLIFVDNTATARGGGVYLDSVTGSLSVASITGNSAASAGGGIIIISSPLSIDNLTVDDNSAPIGGGMAIQAGSPVLTNLTIAENQASQFGGGLYLYETSAIFYNSIIWGNTGPLSPQIYLMVISKTPQVNTSFIQTGCTSGLTCNDILLEDPQLGSLGVYQPETDGNLSMQTVPLLYGSPAIDSGDDSHCASLDGRNYTRPEGTHCDIGAYETHAFTLSQTGSGQTTTVGTAFAQPLQVVLTGYELDAVDGVEVTYSAPTTGASATPASQTVTTVGGIAAASFTANDTLGSYTITAQIAGETYTFSMTNLDNLETLPDVTLSTPASLALLGQTVSVTIQVSSDKGVPEGTVTLYDTTDLLGSATLDNGQAVIPVTGLSLGSHTLYADYSGDSTFSPRSSSNYDLLIVENGLFIPILTWTD